MSLHFSCFVLYYLAVVLYIGVSYGYDPLNVFNYYNIFAQFGAFTLSKDFKLPSYPTSLFFK